MKFSSKEDIAAPIGHVFAVVSDFEAFERGALRRGAEVERIDRRASPGAGMTWKIAFDWRHRRRRLISELVRYEPPHTLGFRGEGQSVTATLNLDLIALSPRRTRVAVEVDIRPKTLGARVVIQSLRLTRGRLTARFKDRVAKFVRDIEKRYDGTA